MVTSRNKQKKHEKLNVSLFFSQSAADAILNNPPIKTGRIGNHLQHILGEGSLT